MNFTTTQRRIGIRENPHTSKMIQSIIKRINETPVELNHYVESHSKEQKK